MDQLLIAVTGAVAIYLTQQKNENLKRYACLFGIAGQPFWFYSAYTAEQWGIFVLCIFYAGAWMLGVYNNWIKRTRLGKLRL